jgi:hypothetical protein
LSWSDCWCRAKEFRLIAQRFDNFDGPIRIDISGLPPGFTTTTPLVIEPEQLNAMGVIMAAPDAPAPTPENATTTKVTATATINGAEATHDLGTLGEIKLAPKPKVLVTIESRPDGLQPVGTSPEGWPEYEIAPGQTIMLQVRLERNGFDDEVRFGTVGSGRNLPFGTYVDNIGLSGLLVDAGQDRREFFVTALPIAEETSRMFHLVTDVEEEQASWPVILHVRKRGDIANAPAPASP